MILRLLPSARLLHIAIACLFITQAAFAPLDALARTQPTASGFPRQQEPPVDAPVDAPIDAPVHNSVDELPPKVPGAGEPVAAPETEPSPEIPDPLVPVELSLSTDDDLLRPSKVVRFEVKLWRYADATSDLTVRVQLPEQLEMDENEPLTWTLPASVGEQPEIVREFKVKWRNKLTDTSGAVVGIGVQVEGAGYSAVEQRLSLGSTETSVEEAESIVGTPEAVQDANGLVLEGTGGDVIVLAEPDAVEAGTVFRYTDLWRADGASEAVVVPVEVVPAQEVAEPVDDPQPVEAAAQADASTFLPLVGTGAAGDGGVQAAVSEPSAEQKIEPQWVDDVLVYHTWQLDAIPPGQTAGGEHVQFKKKVKLQVNVQWLLEAGVDPSTLDLWTRPDESQPWERVETQYNEKQNVLTAKVDHFSEWGLGGGITARREVLPSVSHLSSDLQTGAAMASVPIEAPAGLGGMSPGLSLNYSSGTVDDIDLDNDENNYKAQAGTAGLGWGLGGISYIALTDYSVRTGFEGHGYQLVLNGASTQLRGNQAYPETFAKIQKNLAHELPDNNKGKIYFSGEWIITTPDGTKHYFGSTEDPRTLDGNQRLNGFKYQSLIAGVNYWVVTKWYLRKSVDPLGNQINYNYAWDMGRIGEDPNPTDQDHVPPCSNGGIAPGGGLFGRQSYHRDVRLQEVLWSSNATYDGNSRMRVLLDYQPRDDYEIEGWESKDCKQVLYSTQRLKNVRVQVKDTSNTWQLLRQYDLGYRYSWGISCSRSFDCFHSLLETITERGMDGGALNTQRFDYNRNGTDHGQIHLDHVENGWGGTVEYGYQQVSMRRCQLNSDYTIKSSCSSNVLKRWKVSSIAVYDGLGNRSERAYSYTGALEIDRGGVDHYLGHSYAKVTYRTLNSSSSVQKVEETWFYQGNIGSTVGQSGKPDPRVGRTQWFKVHRPKGSGCSTAQPEQLTGYCRMSQTNTEWTAWRKDGSSWVSTSDYAARPLWVRQESEVVTTDGAADERYFYYETSRQNNQQFGNVTKIEEGGSAGSRLRATTVEFFPNVGAYIVGLPARTRIYGSGGDCYAESRTIYGRGNYAGNYNTQPGSGLVAKTEQALTGCSDTAAIGTYDGNWATTHFDYDVYGNVITEHSLGTDSDRNLMIKTVYDGTYHLFPVEQYNEHRPEFKETAKYWGVNLGGWTDDRLFWGAMGEHCGVNGACTRQAYDEFGRATYQWARIPTGTSWSDAINASAQANTRWVYTMHGQSGSNRNVITEWHSPRCTGNFVRHHYNGIGQLVQEQTPDQDWTGNTDGCNPGNNYKEIDVSYQYDALGHQTRASVPSRTSAGWVNRALSWSAGYTSTSYDVLGRPVQTVAPNGETTKYSYSGRISQAVAYGDSTRKSLSWQDYDELGRLQAVRDYSYRSSDNKWLYGGVQVSLSYDKLDNLTRVDHIEGGSTTMTYDAAGRKRSMNDPDLGAWSYLYDRQGHLVRQTDARGKSTCLFYEARTGRLEGKFLRDATTCPSTQSSYHIEYSYDSGHSASNRSRGQLTRVRKRNSIQSSTYYYDKQLTYDGRGRLASESVAIEGAATTTTQHVYDPYHRPYVFVYPDGSMAKTFFNSLGLPSQLCEAYLDSGEYRCRSGKTIVDDVRYNEAGQLERMRMPAGGNLYRHQLYHTWTGTSGNGSTGNGNRRLAETRVGTSSDLNNSASHNRLRLRYWYDGYGNVASAHEQYSGGGTGQYTFAYDAQNRLTNGYGQSFAYHIDGRFTRFEGVDRTLSNNFPLHATYKTASFAYDANGNMTARPNLNMEWDYENHLARAYGGGLDERYLYDADGQRVRKQGSGYSVYYPFPHYETSTGSVVTAAQAPGDLAQQMLDEEPADGVDWEAAQAETPAAETLTSRVHLPLVGNGGASDAVGAAAVQAVSTTRYYFFNGQPVAMWKDGALSYLHANHLGSVVETTDASGNPTAGYSYYGYGRKRSGQTLPTDHRFTGQKLDGTGLYYYNARYYDPALGQFVSPDTLVPDASRVLAYNRYMYSVGNPLRYNDPTGHVYEDSGDGGGELTALIQLRSCGGSVMCETTNVGQWLRKHPEYDPFVDPNYGQHEGYATVLLMLTQINLDDGNQELAWTYFYALHENTAAQAPVDAGLSLPETAATLASAGMFGPFFRLKSPTQTFDVAKLQEESGEIWGRTPRNGHTPTVQAYNGPLPEGVEGIEFYTDVAPNSGQPPSRSNWSGPRSGVRVEGEYAKICCVVTQNTQR